MSDPRKTSDKKDKGKERERQPNRSRSPDKPSTSPSNPAPQTYQPDLPPPAEECDWNMSDCLNALVLILAPQDDITENRYLSIFDKPLPEGGAMKVALIYRKNYEGTFPRSDWIAECLGAGPSEADAVMDMRRALRTLVGKEKFEEPGGKFLEWRQEIADVGVQERAKEWARNEEIIRWIEAERSRLSQQDGSASADAERNQRMQPESSRSVQRYNPAHATPAQKEGEPEPRTQQPGVMIPVVMRPLSSNPPAPGNFKIIMRPTKDDSRTHTAKDEPEASNKKSDGDRKKLESSTKNDDKDRKKPQASSSKNLKVDKDRKRPKGPREMLKKP
ncbi:uncharacterized protein EI97DRAFT_455438 [Westerdykella ornata]|uniref:Uncharacterized protein n=1 Tax=Westerdykella ornata TaxID=318751 RepID=A0A6A6JVD5_WESOR|nr:uncharacterized protein EI97DRAFT_455438 [Westerdykella ornata]KAF2280552.1 hypothetical protein EI97DRAFT_455438 [Westerdykella ornata]